MSPDVSAADEPVEVVDEQGRVERVVTRAEMRAGNLRHRMVGIVVITSRDEVVVHRRADWKDVWPGRWDVGFGGVAAVGESWRAAAVRELGEEAGITVTVDDLVELGRGDYADDDVAVHGRTYLARHDGPFHPADGEVAELDLVPLDGLTPWLAGRELCSDTRALVVPLLLRLARGDAPAAPDRYGG